jgi:hypothetical protein
MISRLLVIGILYLTMFAGWIGVGFFMLVLPERFIKVVRDNVAFLSESPPRRRMQWMVRIIGAGFVIFAVRFAFKTVALFATER